MKLFILILFVGVLNECVSASRSDCIREKITSTLNSVQNLLITEVNATEGYVTCISKFDSSLAEQGEQIVSQVRGMIKEVLAGLETIHDIQSFISAVKAASSKATTALQMVIPYVASAIRNASIDEQKLNGICFQGKSYSMIVKDQIANLTSMLQSIILTTIKGAGSCFGLH